MAVESPATCLARASGVASSLLLTVLVLAFPTIASAQSADSATVSATSPSSQDSAPAGFWQRDTLTGNWDGLRTSLADSGIKFGLQEQSELWGNQSGGLRRGVVYDGLTTASLTLDLEKLTGWTGATFFVDAYQIHGRGPSGNLVGNQQIVSNIEATRDTKLYQLWIEQKLLDGRLTVRVGQEGANDQMMITQYGALFLNSSFGFPGLPAADLPSGGPNYPMATPMVRVQFQATDKITLVGAVFNGDPAPPGTGDPQLRDAGGTAFRLNGHALAFTELWYSTNQGDGATGLPATYKLGAWYDSAQFADQLYDTSGLSLANPKSSGVPREHSPDFAFYGIVDQMIWRKPGSKQSGVGVFLQVMGAPNQFNLSNLFVEGGLNWMAPFAGRDNDVFGIGVSYLGISPAARRYSSELVAATGTGQPYASNETVVEATYLYQVTPWWTLQPDLQIVINPGAGVPTSLSTAPLKNAIVGGVRATIVF
ncbi:carbohydrate porin [Acidisphaera sp. S103]|uniref:carbohydrate porin n=1 Tax=Acidisphaera sp. S103 TaxID=1747223 RepID=UPI00131D8AF9|nr:carbohydrate porin [Acidisphaera sp. S103]